MRKTLYADKALKNFYLGVVADELNTSINPFLARVKQTSADVWGKEIRKLVPNEGQEETQQFVLTLKNLFGKIEISDKAMCAAWDSAGAFVNLLNAELDELLKAAKFNFGRMLYGDGHGLLATTVENAGDDSNAFVVDSTRNLLEGITLDIYDPNGEKDATISGATILEIDREANVVRISARAQKPIGKGYTLYVQEQKDNEITGLEAIFKDTPTLYEVSRADYAFMRPYKKTIEGKCTLNAIYSAINEIEFGGGQTDFILCSFDVRRQYLDFLAERNIAADYINLDGGYKALSCAGIPIVADRFVADDTMYLLNSNDFTLHQLCDWRWLEDDDGCILRQRIGKSSYTATLVKYADLMCECPAGQGKITFVNGGK